MRSLKISITLLLIEYLQLHLSFQIFLIDYERQKCFCDDEMH